MTMPPKIIHIGYDRSDNLVAIASDAAAALHMGKGERNLLLFYAGCSSGFRPSLQAIANATGQNRSQVYRNRASLIKKRIVAESADRLKLDWRLIKIYASMDPRMTSKRSVLNFFDSLSSETMTPVEFRSLPLPTLLPRLGALPPASYSGLMRQLNQKGG